MRKVKFVFLAVIALSLVFIYIPIATPQSGTYTFHSAVGDETIYRVITADNASINNFYLHPSNWSVADQEKLNITAINFTDTIGSNLVANYTYNIWDSTNGTFNSTPTSSNLSYVSFYSPVNLTDWFQSNYHSNLSFFMGGEFFMQLPTPVDQYLQNISWAPGCKAVGNTIVFNMSYAQNWTYPAIVDHVYNMTYVQFCALTYTYDRNTGMVNDYKIQFNNSKIIYEMSIEKDTVPGFGISTFIGSILIGIIAMSLLVNKKFHLIEKIIDKTSSNF